MSSVTSPYAITGLGVQPRSTSRCRRRTRSAPAPGRASRQARLGAQLLRRVAGLPRLRRFMAQASRRTAACRRSPRQRQPQSPVSRSPVAEQHDDPHHGSPRCRRRWHDEWIGSVYQRTCHRRNLLSVDAGARHRQCHHRRPGHLGDHRVLTSRHGGACVAARPRSFRRSSHLPAATVRLRLAERCQEPPPAVIGRTPQQRISTNATESRVLPLHATKTGSRTKMPKSPTALQRNPHMADVHTLGHPDTPPPRTRWVQPTDGHAAEPFVQPMKLPTNSYPEHRRRAGAGSGNRQCTHHKLDRPDNRQRAQRRQHL